MVAVKAWQLQQPLALRVLSVFHQLQKAQGAISFWAVHFCQPDSCSLTEVAQHHFSGHRCCFISQHSQQICLPLVSKTCESEAAMNMET